MVVRHHADAVGVELVERVPDLLQRSLDVGQWQGGPEAELLGTPAFEVGRELVAVACEMPGKGVVVVDEVDAWRGYAEDRLGDVDGAHHFEVGGFRPWLVDALGGVILGCSVRSSEKGGRSRVCLACHLGTRGRFRC